MIITPLGHTEFLIDIENNTGDSIRILVDAWFSDYAIGDLMERTSRFRLDQELIPSIDAIYISHAHCDHFDPYTLFDIYTPERSSYPILILPETLKYLEHLILRFIPLAQITWLSGHEGYILKGIEISGVMFEQENITNEDDVMMLSVTSDHECLFAEIDTLPDDSEEVQKRLNRLFSKKKYDSILYLASRNELEGNLKMLDSQNDKDSENFKKLYLGERREEIEWGYAKWETEEYENRVNFMEISGFCRGFIGQGICYPRILSEKLAGISVFSLPEVVDREVSFATEYGFNFSQKALLPGRQYIIKHGVIEQGRKECSIGKFVPYVSPGLYQNNTRIYASGPLFPRELGEKELKEGKTRILDILNHRFLPYWSASPLASLRSALIKNREGKYRIGFKYQDEYSIFEFSFASSEFEEVVYTNIPHIDEEYWILDILDFLDGKQELYSNFWHKLQPNMIYRLWTCLGANFCNNECILNKYTLHFERATQGLDASSYVENVYNTFQIQ